jgi:hypothetical protein
MKPTRLTIENWQSELKRLLMQYNKFDDKASDEAKGIMDHIDAVRSIIKEMKDNRTGEGNFTN